jgi:peptidoglycan hydrolase CwlO-like protein
MLESTTTNLIILSVIVTIIISSLIFFRFGYADGLNKNNKQLQEMTFNIEKSLVLVKEHKLKALQAKRSEFAEAKRTANDAISEISKLTAYINGLEDDIDEFKHDISSMRKSINMHKKELEVQKTRLIIANTDMKEIRNRKKVK